MLIISIGKKINLVFSLIVAAVLFFGLILISVPGAIAAEYSVKEVGDWQNPEELDPEQVPPEASITSLAGALQNAASGDTIVLDGNLTSGWDNWETSDGYTLIQTFPTVLGSSETLTFNLGGNTLGGTALDIMTGSGTFAFESGTLGSDGYNLGIGATSAGSVTLDAVTLNADALQVGSLMTTGKLTLDNGSAAEVNSVRISGYDSAINLDDGSQTSAGEVRIADGGALSIASGTSLTINKDFTVSGVGVAQASPGIYTYVQSSFFGNGAFHFSGDNLTVSNGAKVDLNLSNVPNGYTINAGQKLIVDGIFAHAPGSESFRAELAIKSGDLSVTGGEAVISGGGILSGASDVNVNSGGELFVSGGVEDQDSGQLYRSTLKASGNMLIGEASGTGTVTVTDGALIDGIQNIVVGNEGTGTLNIAGVNANTEDYSTINSTGNLIVGNNAEGSLTLSDGGSLAVNNTIIGNAATGSATLDGVGTLDNRSSLVTSSLTLASGAGASMTIKNGALVDVTDDAILGKQAGATAKLEISGIGGIATSHNATLQTTGKLIVGDAGKAHVSLSSGGRIVSGGATLAGAENGSEAVITMSGSRSRWTAGGTAILPGGYTAPLGNTRLTVSGGVIQVNGLFAMAGQSSSYFNDFGIATFSGGSAELFMKNGSFYNRDQAGTIGKTLFSNGAIVSGTGHIYAGDIFSMNGGVIAPGIRNMYAFDQNDKLTGLGTVHIHDNSNVKTEFYNTTFQTKLDRGNQPDNSDGLSDRAYVYGDLDMDANFKVSISRPLDGDYLLIRTEDGGTITNFTPQSLSDLGSANMSITLNGKLIKGNDRLDRPGGMVTRLDNNDTEIWLTVDTGGVGNVKTWWTGNASGGTWDMTARNFYAKDNATFAGGDQFLDGDIVVFDFGEVTDPSKRTANVTTDAVHYAGNLSSTANVFVAEVQVLGSSADDTPFVWNGGSIFAYDSAVYSTLDQAGNGGVTPSGQLIKIGEGTLEINNANEFYGGVHLGGNGSEGGLIVLNNEKGFGTYDSSSGYLNKGQVFVHENTTVDVSGVSVINNRFVIDAGKILTFELGDELHISGNNALHAQDGSKGGGIFIGNAGKVIYTGTGVLNVTNNMAAQGGGIYAELAHSLGVPVNVENNYASKEGGGIYAEAKFALKDGSAISGNAAQGAGGGIYAGNVNDNTDPFTIHGNTIITGNLSGADSGGGVYVTDGRKLVISTAKDSTGEINYGGGDVWFANNYANVGFDPDDPAGGDHDLANATRNAVHLESGATMTVGGPYNTYFYDPITGEAGARVTITGVQAAAANSEANHNLQETQYGTVVFRGDSAFYGSTAVTGQGTFRLESSNLGAAVYGRKGNNTFELAAGAFLTGSGTIMAGRINLNGTVDLDTGAFSRPDARDGSGTITAADAQTQGLLAIEGDVSVDDTAIWLLNLTNTDGNSPKSDLITVAGNAFFDGTATEQKLTVNIDKIIHGRYTIMTSSGTIANYTQDRRESDAFVYLKGDTSTDLAVATSDANNTTYGRLLVTSYVDPDTKQSLYLDIAGRNRHVTASGGGNWGYDPDWFFDNDFNPINTGGNVFWSKADNGPNTNAYLDGDMVTLTGSGTYTLITKVNPVDLIIDNNAGENITIAGSAGSITTFALAESTVPSLLPDDTTILPEGSSEINDYGIPLYTGKLIKRGDGTLTFTNTGDDNYFMEGIDVHGGTIAFSTGRQIRVTSGRRIHFLESGTLYATGTSTTNMYSAVKVDAGKTVTFDIDPGKILKNPKLVEGDGAMRKTGEGTLELNWHNTFKGGTEFAAGKIVLGDEKAFNTYDGGTSKKGLIEVTGPGEKTLAVSESYEIQNRFIVRGYAANSLLFDLAGGLTIQGDDATAATDQDGGAILVKSGAADLGFNVTGGALILDENKARDGGAIYSATDVVINNNSLKVTNNSASRDGGGIYARNISVTGSADLTGNKADGDGGALYIADAALVQDKGTLTLAATTGNIVFSGNTAVSGEAVYLGTHGAVDINAAASRHVQFDDTLVTDTTTNHVFTKTGEGLVAFTGNTANIFLGTTHVDAGTFRLTDGSSYGYADTGNPGIFNLAQSATVSGGGTINLGSGGTFNHQGLISVDKSAEVATVAAADKIGELTINGNLVLTGGTDPRFDVDLLSKGGATVEGNADLLVVNGDVTRDGADKVVFNFNNYATGLYKLIDASLGSLLTGFEVDGINDAAGVFTAKINGQGATQRHVVTFLRGSDVPSDGDADNLWLSANINNLYMKWTGAVDGIWTTVTNTQKANWDDVDDLSDNSEKNVVDKDTVYFGDEAVGRSVQLGSNVVVTDMIVDNSAGKDYVFSGNFGITTSSDYAGNILTDKHGYSPNDAPQTLTKQGAGMLTFNNGANSFAKGATLAGGGITLGHIESLGKYVVSGGTAGLVRVRGNETSITLNVENGIFQNHFDVTGTNWSLNADKNATIANVASGASAGNSEGLGGAITLNSGSSMSLANTAALTFSANKQKDGNANDIYVAGNAVLNIAGSGNVFINSGIAGSGAINKLANSGITQIGADSAFTGNTNIVGGTFRVVEGKVFGGGGGTFAADRSTIAGGGTIQAGAINIGQNLTVMLSPDSDTLSAGRVSVADSSKYGTLTFDGETTLGDHFRMDYDTTADNSDHDLISAKNGTLAIGAGTVNLRSAGGLTGDYWIMESDRTISVSSGLSNLVAMVNGNPLSDLTPVRGTYLFELKTKANPNDQLWLSIKHNSLDMVWRDSFGNGVWSAGGGAAAWLSEQGSGTNKEKVFANGDYAHFLGSGATIDINEAGVLVSGFEFNTSGNYTFTGAGGIEAKKEDDSIEGVYLPAGGSGPTLYPDGKLNKYGSGTLTFANTGGNTFYEGIEIHDGAIAFNNENQLGDGGRGINFLGDGALQSNANVSLSGDLIIADGVTASLNSNGHTFTVDSEITEISGTGNLAKNGAGTVILSNTNNSWSGSTAVNAGTLQADGVAMLGENIAARTIAVADDATLHIVSSVAESLEQKIAGDGNFTKSGNGVLSLTNENTYGGTTRIDASRLIAETVGAINSGNTAEVIIAAGSVLEMKLDGAAKSGTLNKEINGAGQVVKSGNDSTLTMTNAASGYSGGTVIEGGTVKATDTEALGKNAAFVGEGDDDEGEVIAVSMKGTDTALEFALADADGVFNQLIKGLGGLIKSGDKELTLTHANTFTGGTEWSDGDITLENTEGLSKTSGGGIAGFVYVNTSGTLTTVDGANTLQNRFEVAAGNNLTFASPADGLTITGNDVTGVDGGAIELKSGATFTSEQPVKIEGNTTDGYGGGVYAPEDHIVYGGTGANAIASLTGNEAGGDGGGVYAKSVTVNAAVGGTTISGNIAGGNGGAFYLVGGSARNPAVSLLDTTKGDLIFTGNTANGQANAIHMDQNTTLNMSGINNFIFHDGITSNASGKNGNLINIGGTGFEGYVHFYSDSDYYGDTDFQSGIIELHKKDSNPPAVPTDLDEYVRFGQKTTDANSFILRKDAVLSGTGTIGASSILLGGTVNAGQSGLSGDISVLGFEGDVVIGDDVADGQTFLQIDIRSQNLGGQSADRMDIFGTLNLSGNISKVNLNTFVSGHHLLAQTTDGISGYSSIGNNGDVITVSNFETTVAGMALNPHRFNITYTVEETHHKLYLNAGLQSSYIVWTGANKSGTGDHHYDSNRTCVNQWLNDTLYNWRSPDASQDRFYRQNDFVVFDSVADIAEMGEADALATRENIEIITTQNDFDPDGTFTPATVADMVAIGGGTFRFTGNGIQAIVDTDGGNFNPEIPESWLAQLYIVGDSTVIFANGNEAGTAEADRGNNFMRGINLQNGAVAFNNINQLNTVYENDPLNGGADASHGITVMGEQSYGELIANADDMELGILVNIDKASSALIVNTGGNDFGDASVTDSHDLTIKHAEVAGHDGQNGIYGLGSLVKTGKGTLFLDDENYYTGHTIIKEGTLAVAADNRIGDGGGIILDGGTFRAMDTFGTERAVLLSSKGGTIEVDFEELREVLTMAGQILDLPVPSDVSLRSIGTAGSLVKTGEGTLVLTNKTNTYGGDTIIKNGRLVAQGLETLGQNDPAKNISTAKYDVAGQLQRRSQLELLVEDESTLYQNLTGDGEVIKSGAGTLNLVNASDFAGRLTIEDGLLNLYADYGQTDSFRVMDGAMFGGTGTIGSSMGGMVEKGGTIIPEGVQAKNPNVNPTSTSLTVNGSLTFASGSRYDAVITQYPDATYDPAAPDRMRPVSDCIVVTDGTVSIKEGATLGVTIDYWADNLLPTDFGESTSGRFTVIDAEDGQVEDPEALFDLLEPDLPRGVEMLHGWTDNLYQLWLEGDPMAPCSTATLSHNQYEVCRELGELVMNRDPGMKVLNQILAQKEITDAMLPDIYSQLAGDIRANSLAMAFTQPWRHPFKHLDSKVLGQRETSFAEAAGGKDPDGYPRNVWAEVYGRHTDIDSDGNAFSHDIRRHGFAAGYHRRIAERALLGVALNYSNSELKQRTGKVDLDDLEVGLYGLARVAGCYDLKFYLGYAHQEYDITRRVDIPGGSRFDPVHEIFKKGTRGDSMAASLELSRTYDYNECLRFSPLIAFDYERVWQKGFQEFNGLTALKFKNADQESAAIRVGVNVDRAVWSRLDLHGRAHYSRELGDDFASSRQYFTNATTPTSSMRIRGVERGRDNIHVGVGLEYHLNDCKNASFYLNYDADFRKREDSHSGDFGFVYRW